jgi:cytochrome c oxidase cbb3-type subunit 3
MRDDDEDHDRFGDYSGQAPANEEVHVYDDIKEMDNQLPRWWLYSLYATILFAFGYWFHFHVFGSGTLPMDAYNQEVQAQAAAESARIRAAGVMTPQALVTLSHDAALVRQGQDVFRSTCQTCHGATAGGLIGPNLTDEFWLHGGAPDAIYHTVTDGVPARGMPAWGPQLGIDRVQAVTAYLLTLRNTHAAGGRPPQGDRYEATP